MLPILAVIVGVAASAFTVVKSNSHVKAGTYWYSFTGTQTVQGRQDKTQYTTPTTTEPQDCIGFGNECAVQVNGITGVPPQDISSLNITFDSNGMPDGGTNFETNAQKQ